MPTLTASSDDLPDATRWDLNVALAAFEFARLFLGGNVSRPERERMNLEVLLAPKPQQPQKFCLVGRYAVELEEPYRSALLSILDSPASAGGWSDEAATARMNEAGLRVSDSTVRKHRLRICMCFKGSIA